MVRPYAKPIVQSLIGKLEATHAPARVAARMLEALGELVQLGSEDSSWLMAPREQGALLEIIVASLQDQSSALK